MDASQDCSRIPTVAAGCTRPVHTMLCQCWQYMHSKVLTLFSCIPHPCPFSSPDRGKQQAPAPAACGLWISSTKEGQACMMHRRAGRGRGRRRGSFLGTGRTGHGSCGLWRGTPAAAFYFSIVGLLKGWPRRCESCHRRGPRSCTSYADGIMARMLWLC
jgi:hypothetical protein